MSCPGVAYLGRPLVPFPDALNVRDDDDEDEGKRVDEDTNDFGDESGSDVDDGTSDDDEDEVDGASHRQSLPPRHVHNTLRSVGSARLDKPQPSYAAPRRLASL